MDEVTSTKELIAGNPPGFWETSQILSEDGIAIWQAYGEGELYDDTVMEFFFASLLRFGGPITPPILDKSSLQIRIRNKSSDSDLEKYIILDKTQILELTKNLALLANTMT